MKLLRGERMTAHATLDLERSILLPAHELTVEECYRESVVDDNDGLWKTPVFRPNAFPTGHSLCWCSSAAVRCTHAR